MHILPTISCDMLNVQRTIGLTSLYLLSFAQVQRPESCCSVVQRTGGVPWGDRRGAEGA